MDHGSALTRGRACPVIRVSPTNGTATLLDWYEQQRYQDRWFARRRACAPSATGEQTKRNPSLKRLSSVGKGTSTKKKRPTTAHTHAHTRIKYPPRLPRSYLIWLNFSRKYSSQPMSDINWDCSSGCRSRCFPSTHTHTLTHNERTLHCITLIVASSKRFHNRPMMKCLFIIKTNASQVHKLAFFSSWPINAKCLPCSLYGGRSLVAIQ